MRAPRLELLLALLPALLSCGFGRPAEVPAPERPEAPSGLRTSPSSPSARRRLVLSGSAPDGTMVRVFASSVCDGYPLALVGAGAFAEGVALEAVPSSNNAFSADAASPGGGVSACSEPVYFEQDPAAGPGAPRLSRTVPFSPSRERAVRVFGTGAGGSTVRLYLQVGCAGPVFAQGTAEEFAVAGLPLTVEENAITRISADAVDAMGRESECSSSIQYEHDLLPPAPPVLLRTTPPSPSSERSPCVAIAWSQGPPQTGTARLFATPACDVPLPVQPSGWTCEWGDTVVTVMRNSTTTLFANAVDLAGNVSACSAAGLGYVHDDLFPPTPPHLFANQGSEPLTVNLFGMTQTETSNELFGNGTCAGAPMIIASYEELKSPGVKVSVTAGVTVTFTAVAISTGGTRSACSWPVSYTPPP
ncbi:MAG: hypothetical protein ACYC8T_05840 [Myxococcaceae bacterium]